MQSYYDSKDSYWKKQSEKAILFYISNRLSLLKYGKEQPMDFGINGALNAGYLHYMIAVSLP